MTGTASTPAHPRKPPPAIAMLQMLGGFQVSAALFVAAKLDIATILATRGPCTIRQLAAETGADADALGRLIRFLAPQGVFRTDEEKVEVTELGMVLAEGPRSLRHAALYLMETHYEPFGDLLGTVRTGEPAAERQHGERFADWIARNPSRAELRRRTFGAVTSILRGGMFDGYRLPPGAVVADIGGGDGSMIARFLADDPGRRGIVFDRPENVAGATAIIARHGLEGRVTAVGGDFFVAVPAADVYVLSGVLRDWDDESCGRILHTIAAAARPGARLVIIEAVLPEGNEPHPARAADIKMLVLGHGRERTEPDWQALLCSAGLILDRVVSTPSSFSFIEATVC